MGPVEAFIVFGSEFLVRSPERFSLKGERSPGTLRPGLFLT